MENIGWAIIALMLGSAICAAWVFCRYRFYGKHETSYADSTRALFFRVFALSRQFLHNLRGVGPDKDSPQSSIDPSHVDVPDHVLWEGTTLALARTLEAKDRYLSKHSERVGLLCQQLGQALHLNSDEQRDVQVAGLLHDIGMIAIPSAILNKTGQLTSQECTYIKTHVDRGAEILETVKGFGKVVRYIKEHHERLDGSGYPRGLQGSELSLAAQIVGVAETFYSLTDARYGEPAESASGALDILHRNRGVWYRADIIDALVSILKAPSSSKVDKGDGSQLSLWF